MADLKISQLPAATTPLTGSELVPIVQSGVTDQATVLGMTTGIAISPLTVTVTGSTVPANGMYLSAANTLGWATNSAIGMTLSATGSLGIGATALTGINLHIGANITGNSGPTVVRADGTFQSDATGFGTVFSSIPSTLAASFTMATLAHFAANQGTIGASSAITTQYGLYVGALTGATNNYGVSISDIGGASATTGKNMRGVYSQVSTASGGGAAWNIYAGGTAANYMAGGLNLGATTDPGTGNLSATGSLKSTGTAGIGYATGAGGAVTQATSRVTGVTLNKICGAITLVSAAGLATYQTFTVTNSTVAATDTVIVNQKSGTDLNIILVTAVAAGSFNISFATTGGITVEQPVFSFAVIKGVTS